jgi:Ca2+/Na+ antiporter
MNPSLVENNFKSFLTTTLKKCKVLKFEHVSKLYNWGLLLFLLLFIFLFLYFRYKGKLSNAEIKEREKKKEQYILSRIKNYQDDKRKNSQKLITGLPHWSNEYDDIYRNNTTKYVDNIVL